MPAARSSLSSGAAHSARAFWAPYAASKAAVEALARSWADETQNLPLRVNSVDPGATRTAMRAQAMPGEDPETLPHPSVIAANILPLASPSLTANRRLVRRTRRKMEVPGLTRTAAPARQQAARAFGKMTIKQQDRANPDADRVQEATVQLCAS